MRAVLRLVLFVVAGPYVGLIAIALGIGCYTLATTGSPRDFVFGRELIEPGILLAAYSVGGVPALLTGTASIFIARRAAGWRGWLGTALVGGLISLAVIWAVIGGPPNMLGVSEETPVIAMVTLAGAIAGLVCAALFDGLMALLRRGG
jgi:hypothetical protein